MINFNIKKAGIYQAIRWENSFIFYGFLKKAFFFLSVIAFILFLYGFIPENFSLAASKFLLGSAIILIVLTVPFWHLGKFFDLKIKQPKFKTKLKDALADPEKHNLAEFLTFSSAKKLWNANKFSRREKISEVYPEVILLFILKERLKTNFLFSRALFDYKEFRKEIRDYLKSFKKEKFKNILSEDSQKIILEAAAAAEKKGKERIETGDIISALSKNSRFFQKKLIKEKLKPEDIENLVDWTESLNKRIEEAKVWWSRRSLMKKGTLGKGWTAGYTVTLDKYSRDITEDIKNGGLMKIIGHEKEIESVERILSRTEINNVLLVGRPGTGRKSVVEAIAQRSFLGESLPDLNYKRVIELNLPALIAEIESIEEMEVILDRIFREVAFAGNVILVISDFHTFTAGQVAPGTINISGILSSYLKLPQFRIIGISSYQGLHKYIEQNQSLLSFFTKTEVSETNEKETLLILENRTLILENRYKIFASYQAIISIISLSDRYFPSLPFPKKALDILDETMVYAHSLPKKQKIVLPSHVEKIVSEKADMPVGELESKEKEILLNLEDLIHKRIINQNMAVREVSTALRRARAGVTERKKPMGTFLFLGPTGVGKTETSKALAEIYFSSRTKMIRLDMSEFQSTADIPRLIGSEGEQGILTTQIREDPFSLVLLDEIEKAHPNILNLFLQILDEGHLTDGLGRKVSFKNSIIIATSNAGYKIILDALKKKTEWNKLKEKILNFLFENGMFRPEFINRFDAVVIFQPLSKENLLDISELMLGSIKKNLKKEKGIDFIITERLKEKIVELGYDPKFGARQMKRVIQDKVENILALALLRGDLVRGNAVEINPYAAEKGGKFALKIRQSPDS